MVECHDAMVECQDVVGFVCMRGMGGEMGGGVVELEGGRRGRLHASQPCLPGMICWDCVVCDEEGGGPFAGHHQADHLLQGRLAGSPVRGSSWWDVQVICSGGRGEVGGGGLGYCMSNLPWPLAEVSQHPQRFTASTEIYSVRAGENGEGREGGGTWALASLSRA